MHSIYHLVFALCIRAEARDREVRRVQAHFWRTDAAEGDVAHARPIPATITGSPRMRAADRVKKNRPFRPGISVTDRTGTHRTLPGQSAAPATTTSRACPGKPGPAPARARRLARRRRSR